MCTAPETHWLLLLDIKLEKESGLALAAHLRKEDADCSIIYITAYREYLSESLDTHSLHYLPNLTDKGKLSETIFYDYHKTIDWSRLPWTWATAYERYLPGIVIVGVDVADVPFLFHCVFNQQ